MNARTHRLTQTLGLAIIVAALVAPTALARGGQARGLDPWMYAAIRNSQAAAQPMGETASGLRNLDPWAYNVILRSRSTTRMGENAATRPDDRPGIRGLSTPVALLQLSRVGDEGAFNWRDAGIGGAATLVLVLLVAGGAVLRHDSRRQEAHG